MKKKTQQKVSQKAVKIAWDIIQSQIPPYPRWVKCLFWVWIAYTGLLILASPLAIRGIYAATIMWLLLFLVVSGYGIYRAFRYFTKRAVWGLGILVVLGIFSLLPAPFDTVPSRLLTFLKNSRSVIFVFLSGIIIIHGLIAIFLKSVRKMGWFIFYFVFASVIAIVGQVVE